MAWLDVLIIAAFVAYSIGIGLRARKKASRGLDEYFLAGRKLKGWQAGTSMAATQFAADTPLVTVGLIATSGIFMVWRYWIYGLAFLLMAFVFAGHWQRARVLTDAELTEIRYSGRGVLLLRIVKALYYGTLFNCIVLAWVLSATLVIAEVLLPWHAWLPPELYEWLQRAFVDGLQFTLVANGSTLEPAIATTNNVISLALVLIFVALYSTTGGLRSVVATDFVQFVLAMIGSIALAWILIHETGGLGALATGVAERYGPHASQAPGGGSLLNFAPPIGPMLLPFLMLMGMQWIFQINADGTGYLAQRSMGCEDEREARFAGIIFAWLQVLGRSLPWLLIGVALLVVYPFAQGDAEDPMFKAQRERLFVVAVRDFMPAGLLGVMLVGMLAALASTLDTHMNWGASYWSNDIYKRGICRGILDREPGDQELVLVARLSNVLMIVIALCVMPMLDSIQQAWYISLMFGAGVGGVLVLRWLWERINLWSELTAMLVSLIVAPLLLYLSRSDGGVIPPGDEGEWIRLGGVAASATVAAIAVTWFTPKTSDVALQRFYSRVEPAGAWKRTAEQCGDEPKRPMRELRDELITTFATGLSLFMCLYGAARLMVPHPDVSWVWAATSLLAGVALVLFWWPRARRSAKSKMRMHEQEEAATEGR